MIARLVIVLLTGMPVGTVLWLVVARGFGVAHTLVTIVDVIFVMLLYVWLRYGHPTR